MKQPGLFRLLPFYATHLHDEAGDGGIRGLLDSVPGADEPAPRQCRPLAMLLSAGARSSFHPQGTLADHFCLALPRFITLAKRSKTHPVFAFALGLGSAVGAQGQA
jgi:hypothetical protein